MSIRNQLGITQEQMAEILGISLSLVSMYELGKRDLPTHALIKLGMLTNFVQEGLAKNQGNKTDDSAFQEQAVTILDEIITKNYLKLRKLEQQLKKLKANEQKALAAMQVALYEQLHNKEARKSTVNFIQSQAEKKLAMNNWQEQLACQYEIVALEAMITTLKAHKDKL